MKACFLIVFLLGCGAFAGEGFHAGVRYNLSFEGDSLTVGIGATDRWPHYVTNFAGVSAYVGAYNMAATSGDLATNFANQYNSQIYPYRPANYTNAWLFVWGGVNDIGSSGLGPTVPVDTIYQALSNYWRTARNDGFKIYAFTITDRSQYHSSASLKAAQTNLNNLIIASSNLWDLIYRGDLAFPDSADTNYYSDGLHLTSLGYQTIGAEVASKLLTNFSPQTVTTARAYFNNVTVR